MTEKENSFLRENSRIHSAHRRRPEPKKSSVSKIVCVGGVILLAAWSILPSLDFDALAVKAAAAKISVASAKIELMQLAEKTEDNVDYPSENVNNTVDTKNIPIEISAEDDILMLSRGSRHMPSSSDEERIVEDLLPAPSDENSSELPYPSTLEANDGIISQITYSKGSGENYIDLDFGGQIRNATALSADEIYENAVLEPDYKIKLNAPADEPQVLIMHTHTTESYEPYERDYYDASFSSRTTDNTKNVTAVGDAMAKVFSENGISVYHDKTVHDYPSYNGSYDRSRITVTEILRKYPSIKVVIDVHRDAIEHENGERIAPTVNINGKNAAQVMLICGCDDGTMDMPDCMKNLRTAGLFEMYMEKANPGLTRPVLYDYRKYNQDMTTGSLLLEVGGHANSIDQAIYAGELSAQGIAQALISIAE